MELLEAVDSKLLAFFSKISHRFQKLTGRTNFFLAKMAVCILALSSLTIIADYFLSLAGGLISVISAIMTLVSMIEVIFWMGGCDEAENRVYAEERSKYDFGEHIDSIWWRTGSAALSILWVGPTLLHLASPKGTLPFKILFGLYAPAITIFSYFIVVDPLPPGKSKIREWVEAFSAWFRLLVPARSKASR